MALKKKAKEKIMKTKTKKKRKASFLSGICQGN